jgi:hypothetical protein
VYNTELDPWLMTNVRNFGNDWEEVFPTQNQQVDFVLPENWFCLVTRDNLKMLDEWRLKNASSHKSFSLGVGNTVLSEHPHDDSLFFNGHNILNDIDFKGYVQITTEQFQKYVYEPQFKNNTMSTQKLIVPALDVLRIHAIACGGWKTKIAGEYLSRVDMYQNIAFTQVEVDGMFKAATTLQYALLEEVFGKKSLPIDYDKIKTGSKVMLKSTGEKCGTLCDFDLTKPFDVVFYKTPHFINNKGEFWLKGDIHPIYCTFYQNGSYVLFVADNNVDYITEVIEY